MENWVDAELCLERTWTLSGEGLKDGLRCGSEGAGEAAFWKGSK
jgi:hypothetical protein